MTEPTPPTPQRRDYKRERKQTAQILPHGITHNMMKKYVVYYREMTYLKNGKQQPREYFKVEAHPKLNKPWITSKSVKISLIEKLNDANKVVDDLDSPAVAGELSEASINDIYQGCLTTPMPEVTNATTDTVTARWLKQLPKYATIRIVKDTSNATILSVIYDRKDNLNGFRWTGSHTFSLRAGANDVTDADISLGINKLREKLIHKYGLDLWCV